jgi:uridine phosphorylase
MEEVSTLYVSPGYPAIAHFQTINSLVESSKSSKKTIHVGLTASTSSFYAGQDRSAAGIEAINPNTIDDLQKMKVLNVEMESSIIFTLASLKQCRAGCICVVIGNRDDDSFIDYSKLQQCEEEAAVIALEAFVKLSELDAKE